MTGRQRTFELVPTSLVKQNAAKPPMTSKAAKKAYLQAQKGPRISKAEQRRREAEEYERIRKEHEKERNAAKARAAREKKAAKALAEKEARRSLGLPEPNRFVRASQPTISKFIRGDSSAKRSWKEISVTKETENPVTDSEGEDTFRTLPPPKRIAIEHESEDEFGEFPTLSPSALNKIDNSAASLSAPPSPEKKQLVKLSSDRSKPRLEHQAKWTSREESPNNSGSDVKITRALLKTAEKVLKKCGSEPSAVLPPAAVIGPRKLSDNVLLAHTLDGNDYNREPKTVMGPPPKNKPTPVSRPVLQEQSNNMRPLPRPPVKKLSTSFATPAPKPARFRQNSQIAQTKSTPSMPPSATQAFLEDHLDDFPSPSQQVRELLDDIDDIPSNTQVAREITPQQLVFNDRANFLICTQDLVFTPQDLEEIITPSRIQPKASKVVASKETKTPHTGPVSRDKPRFFEEKDEDLFQAALHESMPARSCRTRRQMPTIRMEPEIPDVQCKPRFFEEKEEDQIKAAEHESKMLAAKQGKNSKANATSLLQNELSANTNYGNFDFERLFEDEEQMQAAIEESKKMAGIEDQAVPAKQPPKRSFKRVLSSTTDYGDDELKGCSQELLALC